MAEETIETVVETVVGDEAAEEEAAADDVRGIARKTMEANTEG